jgi:hypothetical protein
LKGRCTVIYDFAERAREHKRTASKAYREGRKWALHAKDWAQCARNAETTAATCRGFEDNEDAAFYEKTSRTWDELAANAAKWAEESRQRARVYRQMQRDCEKMAAEFAS